MSGESRLAARGLRSIQSFSDSRCTGSAEALAIGLVVEKDSGLHAGDARALYVAATLPDTSTFQVQGRLCTERGRRRSDT